MAKKKAKSPVKKGIGGARGESGKTTTAANTFLSLAVAHPEKRFLFIDGDDTDTKGLTRFFNLDVHQGLHEFLQGEPLGELLVKIEGRDNVYFLPPGDRLALNADHLLEDEGYDFLENLMEPYEEAFDYIIFDLSHNIKRLLGFNILYYVEGLILTTTPRGLGYELFEEYIAVIEGFNQTQREPVGKEPLSIQAVLHYWNQRSKKSDEFYRRVKQRLMEHLGVDSSEMSKRQITEYPLPLPFLKMGQCGPLDDARRESLTLREYIGSRKPTSTEQKALDVFDTIGSTLIS